MNLPIMRRGLSPEGCKIRDRHQGSLTIGIQGITVHPAERGRPQNTFLQENVRRLHEIQARCKGRDNNKRSQPLKATRESSASTTSSVRQADALAPNRNGSAKPRSRSQCSEREGSAHSDYFSLTEEQIEPLVTNPTHHYHSEHDGLISSDDTGISNNDWDEENIVNHPRGSNHHRQTLKKKSQISDHQQRPRSGSPVILKPLASKLTQTVPTPVVPALRQMPASNQVLLSNTELTQEIRKMKLGNLMSKIKHQKPSCEVDYNVHYKTIENQHKMLLDSSDRLSLYGSCEGSARNDIDTQRSTMKCKVPAITNRPASSKMVRAQSFDRDLLSKKNGNAISRSNKLGTVGNINSIKKNLVHPSSPQLRKKFSKSNSNLIHTNHNALPDSGSHDQLVRTTQEKKRDVSNDRINSSAMSPRKDDLQNSEVIQRSKSDLERIWIGKGEENIHETSVHSYNQNHKVFDGFHSDCRSNWDEATNVSVPFNRTSSAAELDLNATLASSADMNIDDQDQSIFCEPTGEKFHLNIRSESQNTENGVDQNGDTEVWPQDNDLNSFDTAENEGHVIQDKDKYSYSEEMMQDENIRSHMPVGETMKTSTPVPNILPGSPVANSSPKLLKKKEQHQLQTSARSSLRRSQYILARKEEERRLAELAQAVDPDCPPGHTPLPDHERRNTLHLLQKSQAEVLRELSSLPVAQDTLRVKRVRHDLEAKLVQIDDGLRIFSQPKVYVMNDD
ncbi:Enkurin domain-containing protein 1-like [Homarus americanus]|uniref:Enkurin domain-containing protein 1-like n=1 Tax=Homarus americanus TaxID=6706 RepID=A0A8J5JYC2_HOMAM|nr:Enkurin domain-containing protein 1-like [Homarus americanus]